MSDDRAQKFADALTTLEQGDDQPLLGMFADDARLQRPQQDHMGAEEDAATFWQQYLGQFESVETSFDRIVEAEDIAVLEWTSTGTLTTGRPIEYAGVSLLTFEDGKVARFATYYDTAAFVTAAD